MAVEFEGGSQGALLAWLCGVDVVPEAKCAVGAGRDDLSRREELDGFHWCGVRLAGGDDVGARVPYSDDAVKGTRNDTRLS